MKMIPPVTREFLHFLAATDKLMEFLDLSVACGLEAIARFERASIGRLDQLRQVSALPPNYRLFGKGPIIRSAHEASPALLKHVMTEQFLLNDSRLWMYSDNNDIAPQIRRDRRDLVVQELQNVCDVCQVSRKQWVLENAYILRGIAAEHEAACKLLPDEQTKRRRKRRNRRRKSNE